MLFPCLHDARCTIMPLPKTKHYKANYCFKFAACFIMFSLSVFTVLRSNRGHYSKESLHYFNAICVIPMQSCSSHVRLLASPAPVVVEVPSPRTDSRTFYRLLKTDVWLLPYPAAAIVAFAAFMNRILQHSKNFASGFEQIYKNKIHNIMR